MNRYGITYSRHGKTHAVIRRGETAMEAADRLCDAYGWRWRYGMVDADTRGREWAELPCRTEAYDTAEITLHIELL